MIVAVKESRLTSDEFRALSGTSLYATMVSNKYIVTTNGENDIADVETKLQRTATGPWYYKLLPHDDYSVSALVVYVSCDQGIAIMANYEEISIQDSN